MSNGSLKVIITGGGTGGHLFPGIAVAQEIKRRCPEAFILFAGTGRMMDQQALRKHDFQTCVMHCSALKGGSLVRQIKTLAKLPFSLLEALKLIWSYKPDLVLGVGGYVTGPVILAARLLGVPAAIHEQNSVPGLANRMLGWVTQRIFLSIPGSEQYFKPVKCVLSGNPVRHDILNVTKGAGDIEPILLVLGGSQGAHRINTIVPEAVALVKDRLPVGFKVIHQSGLADEESVRLAYKDIGVDALVAAFFSEMAAVYQQAVLVVSRAGATTLAELSVLRQAAILIPFPYAADNHQQKNGDYLVREGAAIMLLEQKLTPEILGDEIAAIMADDELRATMGRNAGNLAKPQAAGTIVDECKKMMRCEKSDLL